LILVPRSARRRRSRLDDRALRARRRDADAFARRSTFARAVARESAVAVANLQGYGDAHPRKQCDTDDADRAPVFRAFFVAKNRHRRAVASHRDARRERTMSEDTETFAFQAEINQLLSLIINVRLDADRDRARAANDRGVATRIAMARRGTTARRTHRRARDASERLTRKSWIRNDRRRFIPTRKSSCASSSGARRERRRDSRAMAIDASRCDGGG
jgi:hypothetical protein|tara:strand:+ start:1366 stop:2016 length:651 start_codon:yes stop_codon:yes gene_type:complete